MRSFRAAADRSSAKAFVVAFKACIEAEESVNLSEVNSIVKWLKLTEDQRQTLIKLAEAGANKQYELNCPHEAEQFIRFAERLRRLKEVVPVEPRLVDS